MTQDILRRLHSELAEAMLEEVEACRADGIPISAADKGAIAKFLKDNDITALPQDNTSLQKLREQLQEQRNERNTALAERLQSIDAKTVEDLYGMH